MTTTALPRTLLRALHVTVMASAVGLAAVACAPAGTSTAASAPVAVTANETVPGTTTTTTTAAAPVVTTPTTMVASIVAVGITTPAGAAPTEGAPIVTPAPAAAAPIPAPAAPAAVAPAAVAPASAAAAPAPLAAGERVAPPAVTAPAGDGVQAQAARAVFDATNTFRQQNGVAALVWNGAPQRSAHQHNLAMAAANQMSHQVPGEASFDTRISDQGVPWLSVGENVGFNTDRTVHGALALHTMMINETAPNDGHKVNKLDPKFTELGVDVYLDPTTGKLWLTEDYAQI